MTNNIAIRSNRIEQKDRNGLGPRRYQESLKKTKNEEKLIKLRVDQEESKNMLMRYKDNNRA